MLVKVECDSCKNDVPKGELTTVEVRDTLRGTKQESRMCINCYEILCDIFDHTKPYTKRTRPTTTDL